MSQRYDLVVTAAENGLRLDQAIAALSTLSRGAARRAIERGGVFVQQKRTKVASRTVYEGQRIVVHDSDAAARPASAPVPPIEVLHEAPSLLIIDKPAGVLSAPSAETDQEDLLAFLTPRFGPLWLVHRLDRPTSGAMMFARSSDAARALSEQLIDKRARRTYRAILVGRLDKQPDSFSCSLPLEGKEARTDFTILTRGAAGTLVSASLETGRTHQIRLHAEALGHPVAGDSKYGRRHLRSLPVRPPRLCLHAEELTVYDPDTAALVVARAPFPESLAAYFENLC